MKFTFFKPLMFESIFVYGMLYFTGLLKDIKNKFPVKLCPYRYINSRKLKEIKQAKYANKYVRKNFKIYL